MKKKNASKINNVPTPEEQDASDTVLNEDIIIPDDAEAESEDELNISELLHKYLPDFASDEGADGLSDDSIDLKDIVEPADVVVEDIFVSEEYASDNSDEYTGDELYADEYAADDVNTDSVEDDMYDYSSDEQNFVDSSVSSDDYGDTYSDTFAEDGSNEDYSEYSYVSEDAQYEGNVEKSVDGNEVNIPEDTELDATDINLMVAFGLDDELAKTMGADVAAKLTEEIDAEAKEHEDRVRRSVENEFLDMSQVPAIASDLKKKNSHLKGKLFFSALFTILLLIYENLEIFGVQFGGALNPAVYPVVYIMVSLQIMLFCAAVGYEQLLGGMAEMFTGKFGPSSLAFLGNVAAIVYSVYQAETTVLPNEPVLFNSCAAAMTLFAIVHDYITVKRTMLSFNIVSAKRPKYAVRYMTAADAGIPGGLFEDDDVSEGGVLRIEKTKFVDDFFSRTRERTKAGKAYSAAYLFISVIIAAVMGVIVGMKNGDGGVSGFAVAVVTFFSTMPLSLFVTMSYPFYKGASDAYDYDGTILGESSAEEYAEAGAVCFDDIDAFPSYGVKVQNIKIYNNHRIDRVLYYAASAFKIAGGPLADVFEVATMEIGTSDNVVIEAASEGYLGVKVDDKSIIFGRADKLREYGINLPDSVTAEDYTMPEELCPMYMFREGKLMAKLIIRYMLDSDFEFLLNELTDEGMCACIKTFDPNIDDGLISARLGGGRYPFRVLRYNDTDEINRVSERMASGILSRGTTKPLLSIIGSCSKMLGMRKAGFTVGVISSVIAALIVWLFSTSGGFGSLTSLVVVVYQLLWAIPVVLTAKIFLKQ